MGKRLLDVSPTGVQHYAEVDGDGDELTLIEYTPTEVEDEILESCDQMRSLHQNGRAQLQHAARIPTNTYQQWKREYRESGAWKTLTWGQFEVMKLNSRDNCRLRTGRKGDSAFGKKL